MEEKLKGWELVRPKSRPVKMGQRDGLTHGPPNPTILWSREGWDNPTHLGLSAKWGSLPELLKNK